MTTDTLARLRRELGELVDRRETAPRDYSRYVNDPCGFARDVLHVELWAKQIEILDATRDHPLVVVRGANSVGKDTAMACAALWWYCTRPGSTVLITGPTERQVREILFGREIRRLFKRSDVPGDLFTTALRGPDDRLVLGFTSREASSLTGYHSPGGVLAIVTEGQGVEDFCYEAMMSCTTGADDRLCTVGNPLSPQGRFYAISRPSSKWRKIRVPASAHPNVVNNDPTIIPGGVTREFCERIAEEYGKDSPQYVSRVLAEFPEESATSLIRLSWLERAVDLWKSGALEREARQHPWILSADIGRGQDPSALAAAQGPVLRELTTFNERDLMATTGRIVKRVRAFDETPYGPMSESFYPECAGVVVDMTGIGSGVFDRLVEQSIAAIEFWASGRPEDPQRFLNQRAEAHWGVRVGLERGRIALPDDPALFEEALAATWGLSSGGKIQLTSKDAVRALLGRSPNRLDAAVMALAAAAGGGVSIGGSVVAF